MTITHHASDATLAAYAAGTLDEPRRLLVATHLSLCPQCRPFVRALEHVGGAMLDDIAPVAMSPDSWGRFERRLSEADALAPRGADSIDLPAPLASYELGRWRWIGRGVQWRSVAVPVQNNTRVFMLRADGGTRLPHHRHEGIEWTCILDGAYQHASGRYGRGDFDEADEADEHKPVVEDGRPCICLVALQGNIELQGWLGRLLQPLIRI